MTSWDYQDGAWLGAPSGFIRKDNTKKPSYEMLKDLIRQEWWTDEDVLTDENGWAYVEAFKGEYGISFDGRETAASFTDDTEETIRIQTGGA